MSTMYIDSWPIVKRVSVIATVFVHAQRTSSLDGTELLAAIWRTSTKKLQAQLAHGMHEMVTECDLLAGTIH